MTFWRAQQRARAAGGKLILRIEDVDMARCRKEFRDAIIEDLEWFGLEWDGEPYLQSERREIYSDAQEKLRAAGFIYPCLCSRKDVIAAGLAPHDEDEEPIYPGTCRPSGPGRPNVSAEQILPRKKPVSAKEPEERVGCYNWRFRVPDGEKVQFVDGRLGAQEGVAGKDFGDFVVWRRDDMPAYQLAVAVDDAAMGITEVVRGEDLLTSTFRQLLIFRALNLEPPKFYHTPLILDDAGKRLAKRHATMSLRELRKSGVSPEEIRDRLDKT